MDDLTRLEAQRELVAQTLAELKKDLEEGRKSRPGQALEPVSTPRPPIVLPADETDLYRRLVQGAAARQQLQQARVQDQLDEQERLLVAIANKSRVQGDRIYRLMLEANPLQRMAYVHAWLAWVEESDRIARGQKWRPW